MRYGENPHQQAAFYRDEVPAPGTIATSRQLQGKELSYNNIADSDAAWECVQVFPEPACVIVKHANPCGVALANTPFDAYQKAFATDPTSAFGGIIAFNREVDATVIEAVSAQFLEVLIAPSYSTDALGAIAKKANVRVLAIAAVPGGGNTWDAKRVGGGMLVQTADVDTVDAASLKLVTRLAPTPMQVSDLLFAWRVAKFVKSNAIVVAEVARWHRRGSNEPGRCHAHCRDQGANAGLSRIGRGDAFFPFATDSTSSPATVRLPSSKPGGSVRDAEAIAGGRTRHRHGFTGVRHFRH